VLIYKLNVTDITHVSLKSEILVLVAVRVPATSEEDLMHSTAFALFVDSPAGGGPNQTGRRVIPLPFPATNVRLSLAFDDFGGPPVQPAAPQAIAHIRIIGINGAVTRTFSPFSVPIGRSALIAILPGEVAASIHTDPIAGPPATLPAVTALVEFG
jgi:hypothetical protein